MLRDLQKNSHKEHKEKTAKTSGDQSSSTQHVTTSLSRERGKRKSKRKNNKQQLVVLRESYANSPLASQDLYRSSFYSRNISNQEFVSAKFRFYSVKQDVQIWSQNSQISWNHVQKVIVNSDGKTFCPICLEIELCCPVVTACGHIFCGACLLHSIDVYNPDQWPKCPCCHKPISWEATRFCEIAHLVAYKIGDLIDLILLERPDNFVNYVFAPQTLENGFGKEHWETYFQRIRLIRDVEKLFEQDLINLRLQLISGHPVFEQPYLFQLEERIQTLIEKTKTEIRREDAKPNSRGVHGESVWSSSSKHSSPSRQLYQSQDGQNYFLDNLTWKCLHCEFGNKMPAWISGRIVDIWSFVLNEEERKHYSFLKHLPPLADVSLVELNLSNILSEKTMEIYGPMIEERRWRRIKSEMQENWEKEAAILRVEKESLERLARQSSLPSSIVNWREAPRISDEAAFPTLKQHPASTTQPQQSSILTSQLKQPFPERRPQAKTFREAETVPSKSCAQESSAPKEALSGSWGVKPKIGSKLRFPSSSGSGPLKINVKSTGGSTGRRIVAVSEAVAYSSYDQLSQSSPGAVDGWRTVSGRKKRKQKRTKE